MKFLLRGGRCGERSLCKTNNFYRPRENEGKGVEEESGEEGEEKKIEGIRRRRKTRGKEREDGAA